MPRYWVDDLEVQERMQKRWYRAWLIGFKKVTSPTNQRTTIVTILPNVAVNDSIPLLV
jgi:hypothetical protein